MNKIKRLKLKKNQSDDEDDERFLERYSGSRSAANAKQQAQSLEQQTIQEQLSQLTEKFQAMQETADDLRKTISSQNNDIKKLMTELLHLRTEGEKKFRTLLADLVAGSQDNGVYVDQQQLSFTRMQNQTVFNSHLPQHIPPQKANLSHRAQYFYEPSNDGMDVPSGWYPSDPHYDYSSGIILY